MNFYISFIYKGHRAFLENWKIMSMHTYSNDYTIDSVYERVFVRE